MAFPDIFNKEVSEQVIARLSSLSAQSQPKWGKMNVAQMLAHCSVTYEMVYTDKHAKPNGFMRWMLKTFVKKVVVGDKPYKHNSRTAPQFLITDEREFEAERSRLIDFIRKTQALGRKEFEGKESNSFGNCTANEWNSMFYKHLDHHLQQFGA